MQETFELTAKVRTDAGKGASRRLRREGGVPAIMYGGSADPVSLTLDKFELAQHLEHEAFYSHVLTIKVDGAGHKAVLRDVQRHPAKPFILHVDFLRVSETETIRMQVPLHFLNEDTAIGVKQQGGIVAHLLNEVEVSCLAKDLPEYINVDLAELQIGDSIHLSQLQLPAGVEIVELTHGGAGSEHDLAVVNIHKTRGSSDAAAGEEGGDAEGSA